MSQEGLPWRALATNVHTVVAAVMGSSHNWDSNPITVSWPNLHLVPQFSNTATARVSAIGRGGYAASVSTETALQSGFEDGVEDGGPRHSGLVQHMSGLTCQRVLARLCCRVPGPGHPRCHLRGCGRAKLIRCEACMCRSFWRRC